MDLRDSMPDSISKTNGKTPFTPPNCILKHLFTYISITLEVNFKSNPFYKKNAAKIAT